MSLVKKENKKVGLGFRFNLKLIIFSQHKRIFFFMALGMRKIRSYLHMHMYTRTSYTPKKDRNPRSRNEIRCFHIPFVSYYFKLLFNNNKINQHNNVIISQIISLTQIFFFANSPRVSSVIPNAIKSFKFKQSKRNANKIKHEQKSKQLKVIAENLAGKCLRGII